ncbi:MAG: SDR family NAD-dependent epimerase/dehydratase [Betaproteobacteria bacterium]|nr:SDR family NAD-dependent epimerase/dehydratase [Betaproteobacteria bacterium]
MNILITGGCGFVGTVLTAKLLDDGHRITVVDTQWFGNHLKPHARLTVLKQDTRDVGSIPLAGVDVVIHLANIANDPGVELNPTLSWEVNVLATQQLADRAVRAGVKHFVFASSGSVYGVKDDPQVTEDLELVPISAYNKTKMVAERVLLSYTDAMQVHCIRPATVCGYSPRMRLDVSVNMLTMQALKNGKMTVFGGDQTRPNIHITDMVKVYRHFLANPKLPSGCYNAGFENISILDIAKKVAAKVPAEIVISASNDPRSYRQNSDKLLATGYVQTASVSDAIEDVIQKYKSGELVDNDQCYTVRWMKHLNLQG